MKPKACGAAIEEIAEPVLSIPPAEPAHAGAMSVSRTRLFETGWRSTERIDQALAVSDLDGANLVVLGIGSEPAWSPDGKRLATASANAAVPTQANGQI